jgi:hypothetical protein
MLSIRFAITISKARAISGIASRKVQKAHQVLFQAQRIAATKQARPVNEASAAQPAIALGLKVPSQISGSASSGEFKASALRLLDAEPSGFQPARSEASSIASDASAGLVEVKFPVTSSTTHAPQLWQ